METAEVAPVVTDTATPSPTPVQASDAGFASPSTGSETLGTEEGSNLVEQDPATTPETQDEWSGSLDSVEKQTWWGEIPESVRPNVLKGLQESAKSFQRVFTKKTQALADERKAFQAEREASAKHLAEERKKINLLLYADEDPVAPERQKWEEERRLMQEGFTKKEAEWKVEHDKLKGEYETPLNEWKKKHADLEAEHNAFKTRVETEHAANQKKILVSVIENFKADPTKYVEQDGFFPSLLENYQMDDETSALYTDALVDYVKKEAPDLMKDEKLWNSLWKRITDTEFSVREAIELTRERAGKAKPASPAELAMSKGGGPGPREIVRPPAEDEDMEAWFNRKMKNAS